MPRQIVSAQNSGARLQGQRLHYAIAQDVASSQTLHAKPDLAQEKLAWLQRSDADCGDRCGALPLCVGMPVQAREHLSNIGGI